jgi:hypothetical protein
MPLPARDSELIQIMDAELARTTHISGSWLACRPGCTQCCHGAFAINALDVARLRTGMESLRQSNPALASQIESRAQSWLAEHSPSFPGNIATQKPQPTPTPAASSASSAQAKKPSPPASFTLRTLSNPKSSPSLTPISKPSSPSPSLRHAKL